MLNSSESLKNRDDDVCGDSGEEADGSSCQSVLHVVVSGDLKFILVHKVEESSLFIPDHHAVTLKESTDLQFFLSAESRKDSLGWFGYILEAELEKHWVIHVHDEVVPCSLVLPDGSLGCSVEFHGVVAVQMVRRKIQDGAYLGSEL